MTGGLSHLCAVKVALNELASFPQSTQGSRQIRRCLLSATADAATNFLHRSRFSAVSQCHFWSFICIIFDYCHNSNSLMRIMNRITDRLFLATLRSPYQHFFIKISLWLLTRQWNGLKTNRHYILRLSSRHRPKSFSGGNKAVKAVDTESTKLIVTLLSSRMKAHNVMPWCIRESRSDQLDQTWSRGRGVVGRSNGRDGRPWSASYMKWCMGDREREVIC